MKIKSATLLIVAATLIWGGTPPIMKLTLEQVPPFSLAFIRFFFASVILFILTYKNLIIQKEDFPQFIKAALAGVTLNISLFFIGLKMAPAINAALLIAAVPVLTLVAAHVLLKEKVSVKVIIASIIALAGVITIVGIPSTSGSLVEIIGNILLLLSALSWVFHEIFAKGLLIKYSAATVAFYTMAIGALTFLPLAAAELVLNPSWFSLVTKTGFFGILYGIFGASLIAYWAWQKGLSQLPASQASFFFYIDPITGAVLSVILLGEKITPQLIIGGLLITAAVFLVEYHRKPHPLLKK